MFAVHGLEKVGPFFGLCDTANTDTVVKSHANTNTAIINTANTLHNGLAGGTISEKMNFH